MAVVPEDPYWTLREDQPTPSDERCACGAEELLLRPGLGRNPICCRGCNGEVPPETIGFDATLAEQIAQWTGVYNSLFLLWLDSGEFEDWAARKLSDAACSVNTRAVEIAKALSAYRPTCLAWFLDGACPLPADGPRCSKPLQDENDAHVCEACRVIVDGGMIDRGIWAR